jgi:hypothetical protein
MDYAKEVTDIVRDEMQNQNSHNMELIIIILIAMELVSICADKSEWWLDFRWEGLFDSDFEPKENNRHRH